MLKTIFLGLISISLVTFAQQEDKKPIDQFSINLNYSMSMSSASPKLGFGFGVYHNFRRKKTYEIPLGLEFNCTNFYMSTYSDSKSSGIRDANFTINCLTLYLGQRINIGKKIIVFIEGGAFIEYSIGSNLTGTPFSYGMNGIQYHDDVKKKGIYNDKVDFGPQIGSGIGIPVNDKIIQLKVDYKLGTQVYKYTIYGNIIQHGVKITCSLKL